MTKKVRQPAHPGSILKRLYLEPLGLSVTELSNYLNVSRKTVSKIINERGSITAEMALRLAKVFNTTPKFWLNLQINHDLWSATQKLKDLKSVRILAA